MGTPEFVIFWEKMWVAWAHNEKPEDRGTHSCGLTVSSGGTEQSGEVWKVDLENKQEI